MTAAPVISRRRVVVEQQTLWPWVGDKALPHAAAVRHYTGHFFEEATRILTGATPHMTDGQADICPDLSHGDREFIEVKSVSTTSVYLFKHRIEADRRLVASTQGRLSYVYWLHDAPAQSAKTLHELQAMLAQHVEGVLVIPFERLSKFLRRAPEIQLRYNQGPNEKPRAAYRLNRKDLYRLAQGKSSLTRQVNNVCGNSLGLVRLHGAALGHIFPPLTPEQRTAAGELLAELSERFLQVSLCPAPNPRHPNHMVRVSENTSPKWYQRLCATYPAKRHAPRRFHNGAPDTDIRRRLVLRALERLADGVCMYPYDWMLRPLLGGWSAA